MRCRAYSGQNLALTVLEPLMYVVLMSACGKVSGKTSPDAPPASGSDAPTGNGALALAQASSWVPQSGSRTLDFTITRDASTTGALTVHVANLPTGVTTADVAVAAGSSSGTLTFAADTSSTLGASTNVDVELLDAAKTLDTQPFTVMVSGLPGVLDTTYGNAGKAVFPLPDPVVGGVMGNGYVRAVAQYPASAGANANKLVIAAELDTTGTAGTTFKMAVLRANADGTPDTTFGGGAGYVIIDGSPAHALTPVGIAIDSQGRIVVVAYHQNTSDVCLVFVKRLLPTGGADAGFTTFDALPDSTGYCGDANAVAILPNDKILVASTWNDPDGSQRPLLLQLASDGSPDTTAFGSSSSVRLGNPDSGKPTWQVGREIAVDAAGHIYLPGHKCEGGWNATYSACESVIGRVTPSGAWDTTWGTAGTGNKGYSALTFGTTSNQSLIQSFWVMKLDASGNLVVGGYNEGYTTAVLARFLASTGAVDTTFGNSGRVTPVLVQGGQYQEINDVVVESTGNVVGVGYSVSGGSLVATTRYSPAGVLDSGYGTGGVQTTPEAAINVSALLQPDDRLLVVGGSVRGSGGTDLAVWRYWP